MKKLFVMVALLALGPPNVLGVQTPNGEEPSEEIPLPQPTSAMEVSGGTTRIDTGSQSGFQLADLLQLLVANQGTSQQQMTNAFSQLGFQ